MKIQIKYLNGIRFKRFIINSAQRINQMEQYLNDINVFPVADGDTGTNVRNLLLPELVVLLLIRL